MAKAEQMVDGRVCMVLTQREAMILRSICSSIGGHPVTSARWVADNILHSLHKAKISRVVDIVQKSMTMETLSVKSPYRGDMNDEGI